MWHLKVPDLIPWGFLWGSVGVHMGFLWVLKGFMGESEGRLPKDSDQFLNVLPNDSLGIPKGLNWFQRGSYG